MPTIYEIIQKYKNEGKGISINFEMNGEFSRYLDLTKIKELSDFELSTFVTILSGLLSKRLKN